MHIDGIAGIFVRRVIPDTPVSSPFFVTSRAPPALPRSANTIPNSLKPYVIHTFWFLLYISHIACRRAPGSNPSPRSPILSKCATRLHHLPRMYSRKPFWSNWQLGRTSALPAETEVGEVVTNGSLVVGSIGEPPQLLLAVMEAATPLRASA